MPMIRKMLVLAALGLFLAGCGTAAERSEFWKHDTMYRNWDHTFYSWGGYKKCEEESLEKTQEQDWWGLPAGEKCEF